MMLYLRPDISSSRRLRRPNYHNKGSTFWYADRDDNDSEYEFEVAQGQGFLLPLIVAQLLLVYGVSVESHFAALETIHRHGLFPLRCGQGDHRQGKDRGAIHGRLLQHQRRHSRRCPKMETSISVRYPSLALEWQRNSKASTGQGIFAQGTQKGKAVHRPDVAQ
ncbi:unnamed protein product [Sympodiomycopsis kandeliae]